MAEGKFIAYLRVSTARQGRSGLGLEAQRKAVEDFLNGGNWRLVKELVEVESGDAHFLLGLRDAGIDFVCADMPEIDRFTVGIHALVAERERDMISARTNSALAAAKARGVQLGGDRGTRLTAKQRAAGRAVQQERARNRAG